METSTVQAIKLAIVGATGVSKDMLHICVGMAVFIAVAIWRKRGLRDPWPITAVLLAACAGELLDMRDDLASFGYWRWRASLWDVVNTSALPLVLLAVWPRLGSKR